MNAPIAKGWYPDPNAPGVQRYFDGIAWTEMVAAAPGPSKPDGGVSRKTAIAVGVCVLSGIGIIMSMQSASLLTGTGPIWIGVGFTAAAVAAAFFLGAEKWVRSLAVVVLIAAVFNAGYMEKQLADKRNEISHMFNQ